MYHGVIKSFDVGEGYGFLTSAAVVEQYGRDVFLHRRQLKNVGKEAVGCSAVFEIELNDRNMPQARNFKCIDVVEATAAAIRMGLTDIPDWLNVGDGVTSPAAYWDWAFDKLEKQEKQGVPTAQRGRHEIDHSADLSFRLIARQAAASLKKAKAASLYRDRDSKQKPPPAKPTKPAASAVKTSSDPPSRFDRPAGDGAVGEVPDSLRQASSAHALPSCLPLLPPGGSGDSARDGTAAMTEQDARIATINQALQFFRAVKAMIEKNGIIEYALVWKFKPSVDVFDCVGALGVTPAGNAYAAASLETLVPLQSFPGRALASDNAAVWAQDMHDLRTELHGLDLAVEHNMHGAVALSSDDDTVLEFGGTALLYHPVQVQDFIEKVRVVKPQLRTDWSLTARYSFLHSKTGEQTVKITEKEEVCAECQEHDGIVQCLECPGCLPVCRTCFALLHKIGRRWQHRSFIEIARPRVGTLLDDDHASRVDNMPPLVNE
ncbi:hypothetical protein DIPPA_18921 [Diplonema papillatum]|nr:hypothetical protein DIPPA_18921 [Diplonema papillatum]